jgi:hypothetical protein
MPYQQDNLKTYGQSVSKAEEPVIGDGANPSCHKGPVRYRRGTLITDRWNMLRTHTFDLSPIISAPSEVNFEAATIQAHP